MSFIGEYFSFLRKRAKWWIMPTIILLIILSGIIVFAEKSVLAPFLYTLF